MASPSLPYSAVVNIVYKRTPTLTFDTSYLVQTHLPMASAAWTPHGFLGATVIEAPADSDYAFIIAVRFATLEGWQRANENKEEIGRLMADVANFTNGVPDFVVGSVVPGGIVEAS
jgi:hypothetical protein